MAYQPPTPNVIDNDLQNAPSNEAVYEALATKQPSGNYITALTGQVTATGPGSVAATIATNTVSNSNLAQVATQTFKGRTTAATGNVEDLTASQATAILNVMVGDSGSGGTKGLVPAPAAGDAAAGKYLKADGTWAAAGGLPSQTGNADKMLVTDGTSASWQYAGLGAGSLGTGNVIVGRAKPTWTGTNGVLVGTTATSSGSDSRIVAVGTGAAVGQDGVAIGYNAAAQNTGTGNSQCVAVGASATCNGTDSVAVGYTAATGQSGIAIGRDATVTNLGGGIAIGRGSSTSATGAATHGIAIGYTAKTGTGLKTIIIGHGSGQSTATGATNTVVGSASFNNASLTSAYDNVIVGAGAGTALTTGFSCVLIGSAATCGATDEDAIAIGNTATGAGFGIAMGKGTSTASQGVAIGAAGRAGSESVSVGRYAGYYNNGTQSVAIGVRSNAGNTLGTTVGFRAGGPSFSATHTNGTHIGAYSGNALTTGSSNVFLGYYAGGRSTTQNNELFIDNQDRSTYAGQQTGSILYGVMSATASSQTLTTNSAFTATYGMAVSTVGYGLSVKGGSNAKIGIATFSGVSSVTVSTTAVTSNSIILVTNQSGGYAPMCVNNIVAGTSFDIQHNNTFTGTVAWMIVEKT